jgi:hypothetical protein
MAVTGTAAAPHSSSTPITAAIAPRNGTARTATTSVATARRLSQRVTPAPASGPSASRETSRATAICSADPGTMTMMNADISAASEP